VKVDHFWLTEIIIFDVFTALAMKKAVFWDIISQFILTGNALRHRYKAQLVNAM
jgi:hypothetical protein